MNSPTDSKTPIHLQSINEMVNRHSQDPNEIDLTVKSSLHHMENINRLINAVIWSDEDHVLKQIDQLKNVNKFDQLPLLGVPVLVKEIDSSIAGTPNSWGNIQLKRSGYCDQFTSNSVLKLMNAGAIIVGKTNNPELALTVTTKSKAHGPCNNPLDKSRNSGGSSGGSAAGVASGISSIATGTDGGGSVRIPSSLCGTYGFKASRNAISLGPMIDQAWAGLVSKGLFTSNLEDLIITYNTICENGFSIPTSQPTNTQKSDIKIGIRTQGFANMYETNPHIIKAIESLGNYLEQVGYKVEYSSPSSYDNEQIIPTFLDIISYNTYLDLQYVVKQLSEPFRLDECEPETQYFYESGKVISNEQYEQRLKNLEPFVKNIQTWHEKFDILITPTTADLAPHHGYVESDLELLPFVYGGLCFPSNMSGAPVLNIPLRNDDESGLSCGAQIIGTQSNIDLIFEVGKLLNSDYSDVFVTENYYITR